MAQGPAARILWHSADRYEELCNELQELLPGDEFNWHEATNSLLVLNALSQERHEAARKRIEGLDLTRKVYFPIDPRVYALAATLIMDGRDSGIVREIAEQLRATMGASAVLSVVLIFGQWRAQWCHQTRADLH